MFEYCVVCKDWYASLAKHKLTYEHVQNKARKSFCQLCDRWVADLERHERSNTHKNNLKFNQSQLSHKALEVEESSQLPLQVQSPHRSPHDTLNHRKLSID